MLYTFKCIGYSDKYKLKIEICNLARTSGYICIWNEYQETYKSMHRADFNLNYLFFI